MSITFDCQIKENQIQIMNLLFHFHFLMLGDVWAGHYFQYNNLNIIY